MRLHLMAAGSRLFTDLAKAVWTMDRNLTSLLSAQEHVLLLSLPHRLVHG